jgi:hypothetical protein
LKTGVMNKEAANNKTILVLATREDMAGEIDKIG